MVEACLGHTVRLSQNNNRKFRNFTFFDTLRHCYLKKVEEESGRSVESVH